MQHVALEGRCFVLSCNQFSRRSDFPADYEPSQGRDADTVISRGGSCIVSPLGEVLAGPNFDGEGILTADLDLGEIPRAKFDLDVVGPSSERFIAQTEDISTSGMLILTPKRFAIGTSAVFNLTLSDDSPPIIGLAEVTRHTEPGIDQHEGMGFRFVSFEDDGEERLRRHLASFVGPG